MNSLTAPTQRTIERSYSEKAIDIEGFLSTLQTLIREPAVVGTEDSFFRTIRRELEELDVDVSYYQGILVAKGNDPQRLILSAHIDRHGLLCTGPKEFQYAAFIAGNRGEMTGESVSEQMMNSIADRLLVLDTSPYPTRSAADAQEVVLRHKDSNGAFAIGLTRELAERCKQFGIRYSFKDEIVEMLNSTRTKPLSLGRTELGRLVAATEGKISGTTLQIPTTGYHTTSETTSLQSISAALRLLFSFR